MVSDPMDFFFQLEDEGKRARHFVAWFSHVMVLKGYVKECYWVCAPMESTCNIYIYDMYIYIYLGMIMYVHIFVCCCLFADIRQYVRLYLLPLGWS